MDRYDIDLGLARADLCRFLAACYYEPGPEFREERLFDSMLAAAARVHAGLAESAARLGEAFESEDPQRLLLVDYARLFLGPTQTLAAPYGCLWLDGDGSLMQGSTVAVANLYRESGFEIADEFRELPDHVAAELEFLYLLIHRECEGRARRDLALATRSAALRRRLLTEHLGAWIPRFAAALRENAQTAFYRELASITDAFVAQEGRNA